VDKTPVAPEERYARHGHFPALLLLEGRPALAVKLERLLFERGFEVLHLNQPEFSSDSFADTVRLAQKAGIVVLYSGGSLSEEAKRRVAAEFSNRFFDLISAPRLHGSDEEITRNVLALTESLRLVDEPRKNRGRVN
jgi:RNase P/RNase MRP subunit p30